MEQKESNQFEIDDKLDWDTLHEILKAKYDINNILIKYIDDENDEIIISSQNEFKNAYALAALTTKKLKLLIRNRDGKKIDEILMNITKEKIESIKPVIIQENKKEDKLINIDSILNFTTMIDSKINTATEYAAFNNIKNVNNPPLWFHDAIKNLKIEILNEIDGKLKPIYEIIEELKRNNSVKLNNSSTENSDLLSIQTVQTLLNELEEAKLLKDILKVKNVEDELKILNAFNGKFIRDCNVPDGTKFEVNTKFKKSWLLQNIGRLAWLDSSINLVNIAGNIHCVDKTIKIPFTNVNDLIEVEVELIAPDKPGLYISEWVLMYQNYIFGCRVWCAIEVIDNQLINVDIQPSAPINSESEQQLHSPLIPLIHETNRKFSTSTQIDEKFKDIKNMSDFETDDENVIDSIDDDNEFVIIPDCLNLNKKWDPTSYNFNHQQQQQQQQQQFNQTADSSFDYDCELIKKDKKIDFDQNNNNQENINTQSTLMLINELLLIPKYENSEKEIEKIENENKKLQNLMTFSTSINDETKNDESIENIKFEINDADISNLNNTLTDEKDLLIFSNDYSNINNQPQEKEKEESKPSLTVSTVFGNGPTGIVKPPTPKPTYSPNTSLSLDPADRLLSMGFANRSLNNRLLNKYDNDINKVIEDLLGRNDNDWAANRH